MKKSRFAIAGVILALASMGAMAAEPLGYPGSNWSELTFSPGVIKGTKEDNNILLQGKVEQGIDWMKVSDKWKLNTYASFGYSMDKNKLDYNNKLVPAVGVKLVRDFDHGVLNLGVQAVHERHFNVGPEVTGPVSGSGVQVYASYWFGWNLKK